jgi:hypothetical protein
MRPKLKEKPVEWLKFTLALSAALALLVYLSWRKGTISGTAAKTAWIVLAALALLCCARPAWFRPLYRAGMTVGFYIGQVVGRILLSVFFFLVLTPLGILLRLLGKDLLNPDRKPGNDSYWRRSRAPGQLDREF